MMTPSCERTQHSPDASFMRFLWQPTQRIFLVAPPDICCRSPRNMVVTGAVAVSAQMSSLRRRLPEGYPRAETRSGALGREEGAGLLSQAGATAEPPSTQQSRACASALVSAAVIRRVFLMGAVSHRAGGFGEGCRGNGRAQAEEGASADSITTTMPRPYFKLAMRMSDEFLLARTPAGARGGRRGRRSWGRGKGRRGGGGGCEACEGAKVLPEANAGRCWHRDLRQGAFRTRFSIH